MPIVHLVPVPASVGRARAANQSNDRTAFRGLRMDATVTGLLVRGGEVVDGTGSPARREDVRIADGAITEIGPGLTVEPDEQELDAGGATVAPGFIDSPTHFDPTLFWDPSCDPM